jgi:hypothetical protein
MRYSIKPTTFIFLTGMIISLSACSGSNETELPETMSWTACVMK